MKTRTSKAMGAAAALAAIVASVPLAITAYAEPEPTPKPVVEIPDPQGNCDPFKQAVPNWKALNDVPVSQALASIPDISTFNSAVSGGLNPEVNITSVLDNGPYVVFAPTNDAFAALEPAQLDALKADPAALTRLDYYHVFLGLLGPEDVHGQRPTQEGAEIKVDGKNGDIKVNDTAKLICGGIQAENARIYIIDTVLDPASPPEPLAPTVSGTSSTTTTTTHDDYDASGGAAERRGGARRRGACRLARLPDGRPLLCERQRALLGVLGTNQRPDFAHGPGPAGLVTGDDAVVDAHRHPLARPHGQRRVDGDPLGERKRGVDRGAVRHDLVDQAPLERVGRTHRLAGEDQLHRDLARQVVDDAEDATGRGDESALDLGQPELRTFLRHHQVAGEGQFRAAAQRGAVDRRDGRLVDVVVDIARETPLAVVGVEEVLASRDRLEIGSGAEGFTGAGDDHSAHLGVVLRFLERVTHRGAEGAVDGVAGLGPVQRDDEDVAPPLGESGGGATVSVTTAR